MASQHEQIRTIHTDHVKAVRAATDAAAKLTATEQALREKHTALVREREATFGANRSQEEVLANMARLVDETAARWAADYAPAFVREMSGYHELRGIAPVYVHHVKPRLPHLAADRLDFTTLCGLAPDVVKARLAEVIRTSNARFGLSEPERSARLAALDAQIAEVEAHHTELVDGAAKAGLSLPLLASTQERREAEAKARLREQELERQRALADAPRA